MSHANHPDGTALCGELTEFCDELRGPASSGPAPVFLLFWQNGAERLPKAGGPRKGSR